MLHGAEHILQLSDSIDTITEPEGYTHTCVSIPLTDYTPLAVSCLLKTMYARQKLIAAAEKYMGPGK